MNDASYVQVKRRVKAVQIRSIMQILNSHDKTIPAWLASVRSLKFHRRSTIIFPHKKGVELEVKHQYYLQLSTSKEPILVHPNDYLVGSPVGSSGYRLDPWREDKFNSTFIREA